MKKQFDPVPDWEQLPMPPVLSSNKGTQQSTDSNNSIYVKSPGWVTTGTDFQDPTPPQPPIEPENGSTEDVENTEDTEGTENTDITPDVILTQSDIKLIGLIAIALIILLVCIFSM